MKFLCIFGTWLCGFMGLASDWWVWWCEWVWWLKLGLAGDGFGFVCA